jgi:NIPSNAP
MTKNLIALTVVATFGAGLWIGHLMPPPAVVHAAPGDQVFELRTYTARPGRLEALKSRFRDHTIRILRKHNMTAIGYWTPQDAPLSGNTLIYILQHPSREAARANWAAFVADSEWVKAKADSEKDGPLTTKAPDSVFLDPTDFSPLK